MKKMLCLFGIYRNINSFVISNNVENPAYRIYGLIGVSGLYEFTDKISVGGLVETSLTQEALLLGFDSKSLIYNRLYIFNVLGNTFAYFYNSNLIASIKILGQFIELNENTFVGFNFNIFKDKTWSSTIVVMYNINYNKNCSMKIFGNILWKKINDRVINEQNSEEQAADSLNLNKGNDNLPILRSSEESISTYVVKPQVEQELTEQFAESEVVDKSTEQAAADSLNSNKGDDNLPILRSSEESIPTDVVKPQVEQELTEQSAISEVLVDKSIEQAADSLNSNKWDDNLPILRSSEESITTDVVKPQVEQELTEQVSISEVVDKSTEQVSEINHRRQEKKKVKKRHLF